MKNLYKLLLILYLSLNMAFSLETHSHEQEEGETQQNIHYETQKGEDQNLADTIQNEESINIEKIKNLMPLKTLNISKIVTSEKETYIELSSKDLKVGEMGIIMRDLESYKAIVASVEVIKVEDSKVTAKVVEFIQLKQPFLPLARLIPQEEDRVIFRSFNDKAFLIAPNEEMYNAILSKYPFVNFIKSDLLMGFLNSRGKHDPTRKTLPKACNEYAVGLLFIVGSKEIGVLSCQNLKTLYRLSIDIPSGIETNSPFFTQVSFEGGGSLTYMFSSKKTKKDYFGYYDLLINGEDKK